MKHTLITILIILKVATVFAAKNTLKSNNVKWSNNNSWSLSRTPLNSDTVIIPANMTVIVDNNAYSNQPNLVIKISGTLSFLAGGKLNLGNNSVVEVLSGGSIITDKKGSGIINIGSVLKYEGDEDGTITGYAVANSSSGSSGAGAGSGFITGILDITLKNFNAYRNNSSVQLKWETLSELSSDYFEIQTSNNSTDWITLATINAGNYANGHQYSYTDTKSSKSNAYYRLKMVNKTGTVTYSEIVVVKADVTSTKISVYPNPATDFVMVNMSQNTGNTIVNLSSFAGNTVISKSVSSYETNVRLDTRNLPKGIYIVEVRSLNNTVETFKVAVR